jgi:hypothetical protein
VRIGLFGGSGGIWRNGELGYLVVEGHLEKGRWEAAGAGLDLVIVD